MASTPNFTGTPRVAAASVSTANTNRDGTGTIVDVMTGATNGTKIQEVVIKSTGDPADSIVTLFLNDGTTNWLYDEIDLGNPAAGSATVTAYRTVVQYANLVLPSSSWKLRAAVTAGPTSGVLNVIATGGDF
jgi:hypothetical protein